MNTIDIWGMEQKSYESVKQFENDVKWFEHNCRTIFAQNKDIQVTSNELVRYVKQNTDMIHACEQCFQNALEYACGELVTQCKKLHLLVWAKITGHSAWPAKVLAVDTQNGQAVVQFFGDYTFSTLSVRSCFLFSKERPERKRGPRTKQYIRAMEVS